MNTRPALFLLVAAVAAAIGAHTAPEPPKATPPAPGCCHCPADACHCGPVCRCHLAATPPANQ